MGCRRDGHWPAGCLPCGGRRGTCSSLTFAWCVAAGPARSQPPPEAMPHRTPWLQPRPRARWRKLTWRRSSCPWVRAWVRLTLGGALSAARCLAPAPPSKAHGSAGHRRHHAPELQHSQQPWWCSNPVSLLLPERPYPWPGCPLQALTSSAWGCSTTPSTPSHPSRLSSRCVGNGGGRAGGG